MAQVVTKRILCYTAGRTGVGQLVRLLRYASLLDGKAQVWVVTGIPNAGELFPKYASHIIYLEGLSSFTNWGRSESTLLPDRAGAATRIARTLRRIVRLIRPDVFLTSHYDGAIGELSSVYPSLRAIGCTILLGLRDIYDFEQDIDEWKAEFYNILDRYIDKVLVFGSSRTCKFLPIPYMPKRHQSSIAFVGYIPPTPLTTRALRAGSATRKLLEDIPSVIRVLCQSGGGFDGEDVITKCIDAVRWLVLNRGANVELDISLGPFMKREHKARILAKSNYPFIRTGNFLIRDPEHLLTYSIEIAMAGYNTCVEASYYGLPTVLIPRDYPDDKEQMNRAYFFAPNFSNISVFPSFMHSTAPEQLGELLAAKFNGPIDTHHSREDVPFADTETLLDAILES